MNILFILPALGKSVSTHLGLGQVSAALRCAGHDTALLKINRITSKHTFLKSIPAVPDMIAFSCVSHHWHYVTEWAAWCKEEWPDVPVIVGGVHATVDPASVKACASVDSMILGEGEHPIVALATAYAARETIPIIPGVSVRTPDGWVDTPPEPFCQNLDSLAFPDRTIFGAERGGDFPIMAGRGCPFNCTYCCNHLLKTKQDGRYVRIRSADHVLAELRAGKTAYDIRRVIFEDDTFTLMKPWLKEFLPRYRDEIGVPFVANARVGHFDRETAILLKDAGCNYVSIGVETGCERLRHEILKRDMANQAIIDAFDMTKDVGLATYAFYMVGFPTETAAMARETLELHKRLRPEAGFQISVFYPYPNTRLWEISEEMGLLGAEGGKETFEGGDSTLCLKDMTPDELETIYDTFETMRLESSFSDRYIQSNYPWAAVPVRVASAVFGKARLLTWAKAARDRLEPGITYRPSTYDPAINQFPGTTGE